MTTPTLTTHLTRHEITVPAAPERVFALIADADGWPNVFGPTVHAEVAEDDGTEQLLRIWATANGEVRHWTSRRTLDRTARTVVFRQVVSSAPVASMGGEWLITPTADGGSHVVLLHDFTAVDDDPQAVAWIEQAIDRNSAAELAALGRAAQPGPDGEELRFTFSDSLLVEGAAQDVFEFLDRADAWPQRLPHVARLDLVEQDGGVQHLEMDTRSPDGSLHTTVSVRVSFPERRTLVYKQIKVPPVMTGHTGRWVIEPEGTGVRATSWHTVTLDPEGVRTLLGEDATLAEAKQKVRHALGTNSSTTLRHAKEFAEQRRSR
ncbi:aromatase/cyclase [Kitasatospora terrestris]|uniref:SRPBCC family protein n=1 Tax=Kitasatospora terrestris TaxID=258051 RepID=A0ABP9DK15_9ACTN